MTVPRRVGLAPMEGVNDALMNVALDFTGPFTEFDLRHIAVASVVGRWLMRQVVDGNLTRERSGVTWTYTWRND